MLNTIIDLNLLNKAESNKTLNFMNFITNYIDSNMTAFELIMLNVLMINLRSDRTALCQNHFFNKLHALVVTKGKSLLRRTETQVLIKLLLFRAPQFLIREKYRFTLKKSGIFF